MPDALRAAFEGKAQIKVILETKELAEAYFARENAKLEQQFVDAPGRVS